MKIYRQLFFAFFLLLGVGCGQQKRSAENAVSNGHTVINLPENPERLSGRELALAVCGSCHLFPEPDLLPRGIWEKGVLPNMALRLGVSPAGLSFYQRLSPPEIDTLVRRRIFSPEPLIDSSVWRKIVDYYQKAAPADALPQEEKMPVTLGLPNFTPQSLAFSSVHFPLTTLVKFDPATRHLYAGTRLGEVVKLDPDLRVVDTFQLRSPVSEVLLNGPKGPMALTMTNMDPNDQYQGQLLSLIADTTSGSRFVWQRDLPRPVSGVTTDLNQDGREDVLICSYGNNIGKIAWYEKGDTSYRERLLKDAPGARKAVVRDFNGDGLPDVMVLFAQGNENISIFYNQGNNQFRESMVLYFPPVYGSSSFELADFNQDGYPDILYTNGDNADYSLSLKRYHGVRIYLNDQKNNFTLAWFYPMHGASQAVARDFDGDNDLDIATIAFFPDYERQPEEGFVFFNNQGNNTFMPYTFPNAELGRWLTLDAADIDQDGDEDLMLGSFGYFSSKGRNAFQEKWTKAGTDVLILRNNRIRKSGK